MAAEEPILSAARKVLVWIGMDSSNAKSGPVHCGQGLALILDGELLVLTCHHVISGIRPAALRVGLWQGEDVAIAVYPAVYDEKRSQSAIDVAVLRVEIPILPTLPTPLLHSFHFHHAGLLDATGLTYRMPDSFNGKLAATTRINYLPPPEPVISDTPTEYSPLTVFRLPYSTDVNPGISGGIVVVEDGIIGLAVAARPGSSHQELEVFVAPIGHWTHGLPSLADVILPAADPEIRTMAKLVRPKLLEANIDLRLPEYRQDVYEVRGVDHDARKSLETNDFVNIVGRPLSGKTRLAVELLSRYGDHIVLIPFQPSPPPFRPKSLSRADVMLLIDDIHLWPEWHWVLEWRQYLQTAFGGRCRVLCTASDGEDWFRLRKKNDELLRKLGNDAEVYASRVGDKGRDLDRLSGISLALRLGIPLGKIDSRFDGTPGSLLLPLDGMKLRYKKLSRSQVGGVRASYLMDAIKLVHYGCQVFLNESMTRKVTEHMIGKQALPDKTWDALRHKTEASGFGRFLDAGTFSTYPAYLHQCVTYKPQPAQFISLIAVLKHEGEALHNLGLSLKSVDVRAAQRALQYAIAAGQEGSLRELAIIRWQHFGKHQEAEQMLREAFRQGDFDAGYRLYDLLVERFGETQEAISIRDEAHEAERDAWMADNADVPDWDPPYDDDPYGDRPG